jgi:hypothetical protein
VFCFFFAFYIFVLFRLLFLPVYIVVYFLFVFKFTDHCHRVETKLQLINIISHHIISHHIILSCQSYFAVQQLVIQSSGRLSSVDCSVGNTLLRNMGKYLSSLTEDSNLHQHQNQKLASLFLSTEFCRLHLNIDRIVG